MARNEIRIVRGAPALLLAALAALAGRVAAEDPPTARLEREWPAANDAARKSLLSAVVAAPSREAFDALRRAAEVSAGMVAEARFLRGIAQAEEAVPGLRPPDAGLGDVAAREVSALEALAEAAGAVLRALPDAEQEKAVRDALARTSQKGVAAPFPGWAGDAVGRSAKPRVLPLLLAVASERLAAYRKSQGERTAPARKLDEVNAKIADALDRYLKAEQARGEYRAKVPAGLLGTLPQQKKKLEAQVLEHQVAMDAAETERGAARAAVARLLASLPAAEAQAAMDLVERAALGDADVEVRAFGLAALGPVPGERALAHLVKAAGDADARVAATAADALGERREDAAVAALARALADGRWRVRASAAAALGRVGRAAAVPPLLDALARAQGRDLDDLRAALVALTGRELAAAEGPWRAWWEREGATFRGRHDPAGPAAPAAPAGAADAPAADPSAIAFYGIETHSTRVLFILDFSGSMNFAGSERDGRRKKIDVLRDELKKTVTSLPDGAVFNVVGFANDVQVWRPDPTVRSAKTAAAALEWVAKKNVLGATNIYDALETAFKLMGAGTTKDRAVEPVYDTVFFMTDGRPTSGKVTEPDRILAEVRRWNAARRVRLHVVGMGGHEKTNPDGGEPEDDVDPAFLKRLAEENGGQCVLR